MFRILRFLRSHVAVAVMSSLATVLLAGAVMSITHTGFAADDEETIYGCVQARSGDLRVVEDPGDCRRSETAIDWNREGPVGSVDVTRRTEHGTIPAEDWTSVTAFCEEGEVVIGGGYSLGSIGFNDKVNVDGPITDSVTGLDGWIVSVHNDTTNPIDLWVTAICLDSGP
jgi:hypothetical protein